MINLNKILLAAAVALGVCNASATVLFTENFEYTVGTELNTQGKWVTYGTQANGAITVGTPALTFDGYQSTAVGGVAALVNATNSADQDLHACFADDGICTGDIYMSALINISELPIVDTEGASAHNFVLAFDSRTKANAIAAGKNTNNYWRLFVKASASNQNKFTFGLSKNKAAPDVNTTTEYDINTTYLVVLKYSYVEGSANDVLSLFINKVDASEPEADIFTNSGTDATTTGNSNNADYGIGGVNLNQGGTASRTCPKLTIDAIRVATTWAELFNEGEGGEGGGSTDPGDTDVDTTIKVSSSRAIQGVTGIDADAVYKYTGTATVTFIDNTAKRFYAQDNLGGICFSFEGLDAAPCAVGDQITNVTGSLFEEKYQNDAYNVFKASAVEISSSNNSFDASETTLATLNSDPSYYLFRLVRLSGVKITPNESGIFDTSHFTITEGEDTGILAPLAGTNVIGATIPTDAVDLVGISRSYFYNIVSPRSLDDIAELASLTTTTSYLQDTNKLVAINTPTDVIKLSVVAKNLPKAIDLEVTGTGRTAYTVSPATIPAGTSTTDVTVTFTPTKAGKFAGYLYFDSYDYKTFTYYGYDPDNAPTFTVDTSELTDFSAAPDESERQSIYVNTANLIEYANVKVMGEGNGTFRVNTTQLYLKNGENQVNITFAPTAPGTYTERLEISSIGVETQYVTLTGVCVGASTPGDAEGDSFDLDVKNPLPLMNESFDSVEKNKVLSVSRWTNVATEGTRAWWGYTFDDDNNKAAKVTAYDSKIAAGEGEPCVMTLVTPALDSANSGSKILTFRIMGQNLTDNMTDKLEILYMDLAEGELYTSVFDSNSIDLPDTEDESGEWKEYIVDFDGQQIADTFFIGFRFTSTRGVDNSAIYYVDDVTWGRTDVPQIKPAQTEVSSFAFTNQDLKTTIVVHGLNLTGNISLSMGGDNPSKFSLDKTSLPATGGEVTVTFNSELTGVHYAYLILTADGAATAYVAFEINNISDGSGVTVISADANGTYNVYNALGVKVLSTTNPDDLSKLAPGVYIVNGKKLSIK